MKPKKYLNLCDVFDINSEYYKKMQKIISDNASYPKKITKNRELHHIIERNFSKLKKYDIDNRDENLVSLTKYEHLLVHFYAWKCVLPDFKCGAARAVSMMRRSLLCGDIGKSEFLIELLSENNELILKDANLVKWQSKQARKKNAKNRTLLQDFDLIAAKVLCNISSINSTKEFLQTLGILGKTNNLKRYINNGVRITENIENIDLAADSLQKILKTLLGKTIKHYIRGNDRMVYVARIYSFILWYCTEYHLNSFNPNDTLKDVLEKYNDDLCLIEYESYLETLPAKQSKSGIWYNDGLTEGRWNENPDPERFVKGRLNEEITDGKT